MPPLALRLRSASPGLLALPWLEPLASWKAPEARLRDLPVGPSRHLVRFVEVADAPAPTPTPPALYAVKELPVRIARKEYDVLRELETRDLPAVRAAGLVEQPAEDVAILVTGYLPRSWQYRRLFMRMPPGLVKHRERLLDAMAILLVDLHRRGVFWGDCSLANTLFTRDGQSLQAHLVDAETSEVHPSLSDGQRNYDLGILVENVAGDLVDLAIRLERPAEVIDEEIAAAESVAIRYERLWEELHREERISFAERYKADARIRRLNELGFAVDEVRLEPAGQGQDVLRLEVAVAGRRFHAAQLRELTGLEVGEGQATILLNDLRAYQGRLERTQRELASAGVGDRWRREVFEPGMRRAVAAVGDAADPVQAYCDLLEVRWLLSEGLGRDAGDPAALAALAARAAPPESAAKMIVAEAETGTFQPVGGRPSDP